MQTGTVFVIDAYNVILRCPRFRARQAESLAAGREALLRYCTEWLTTRRDADGMYVVFDGDSSVIPGGRGAARGVRSIYSRTGETADERILKVIRQHPRRNYTVVSDDGELTRAARGDGAAVMPVSEFASMLQMKRQRLTRHCAADATEKDTLSPSEQKDINQALKQALGLEA